MVIVDTGYWVALTDRKDRHHDLAVEATGMLSEGLITSWPVLTETCHILLHRTGPAGPRRVLAGAAAKAFEVFPLSIDAVPRMGSLMESYADLPMDLADASLVILAEELGHGRILSTDQRDFRTYRWKRHEPFENLLFP